MEQFLLKVLDALLGLLGLAVLVIIIDFLIVLWKNRKPKNGIVIVKPKHKNSNEIKYVQKGYYEL